MSERWRPREVHRLVTPQDRATAQERSRQAATRRADLIDEHQRRARVRVINGVAKVVLCACGLEWTRCTKCSKPKRGTP